MKIPTSEKMWKNVEKCGKMWNFILEKKSKIAGADILSLQCGK